MDKLQSVGPELQKYNEFEDISINEFEDISRSQNTRFNNILAIRLRTLSCPSDARNAIQVVAGRLVNIL